MKIGSTLFVLATACTLLACGGTSEPDPTPASSTSGEADTADDSADDSADDTAPVDHEEAAPAAGLRITRVSGSDSAPATNGDEPTSAGARAEGGSVVLTLTNFIYHCTPPPSFAPSMEGEVLVVQAQPPSGPGARCVGPHSAVLRIDGVASGAHPVSVRDMQGQEVATATVTID